MFLRSLILRGFKTFADTVELEFSPDARITAIVGPNGCGKSNLLDATRWALGEDNPRELRVASLDHIIFAGTASRKPLSLAEVCLIFDNSSGKFPLPFSEVAIKRRTFREGESEFFINKNPCRLKDIKDLLRDTGLGEGSYSIITQGQIDRILSSKGEERRAVFEEAAGIGKYKARKIAANKKLIAAEQNILRISDLKVEVSEQLLCLESQAAKAREYLEIQKKVRETELALGRKILGGILDRRQNLLAELEKSKLELEKKREQEKKEEEILENLKEKRRKIEIEIEETQVKLDAEKDRWREEELNRRFVEAEIAREEKMLQELIERKEQILQKIKTISQTNFSSPKEESTSSQIQQVLEAISQQGSILIKQLSSLLNFFWKRSPFLPEEEVRAAFNLKAELLQEELQKVEEETERVKFGLQAHLLERRKFLEIEKNFSQNVLQEKLSASKKEKEELNQKIYELEEKIRNQEKTEFSTTSIEIALAKLEGEMNGILEKYSSEYNLTLDEILSFPQEVSNITKAKNEVEAGKRRLRELEPVNLLAIEEFEKVKERLSFIETQLLDLNSARENLQHFIIELSQRAEETFIQTMEQISQVFSETFSQLFPGGEAKISLASGVPPLEAEIEIAVRPSGRKWLPLPLLSGGERALSAIAILFSLLKIRPAPFCFLDEVDAALDEANIGRFLEMLKDLARNTQIIIITHNKRTMAAADNIYGITMEEPGVSKVLSMKLAEVAV